MEAQPKKKREKKSVRRLSNRCGANAHLSTNGQGASLLQTPIGSLINLAVWFRTEVCRPGLDQLVA